MTARQPTLRAVPPVDLSRGVVVTGTDTGVGKTLVCAALARLWSVAGHRVAYVKPVQSGVDEGDDDAAEVGRLAGVPTRTGRRFGPPLAPAVAARLAGERLTLEELVGCVRSVAVGHPGYRLIVEGAGGLLVELGTDGATLADLAAALHLPVLIVARPGLGTLNHTALTAEAIRSRALTLAGVVVSGYPPEPDLASRTNLVELDRIAGLHGVVPALHLGPRLGPLPADDRRWFSACLGGELALSGDDHPGIRPADGP